MGGNSIYMLYYNYNIYLYQCVLPVSLPPYNNMLELYSVVGVVIVIVHLLFSYYRALSKNNRLSLLIDSPRAIPSFLQRVLIPHQLIKAMSLSGLFLDIIYLILSRTVIQYQQQYIYHSILSRGEHCPYYDYNFTFSFYSLSLLAILTQLLLVFSIRGNITHSLTNKVMRVLFISIAKLCLDCHRYLLHPLTRDYQTIQITIDTSLCILLAYLFLLSPPLLLHLLLQLRGRGGRFCG